jgi:GNAT superfamily N-acetyltransferase
MVRIETFVRDALPDDLIALTLLINEMGYLTSTYEMKIRFDLIYNHSDYKTIVAVVNGEIVGMAGLCKGLFYEMNGMYMRILTLIVKNSSRKQGVGRLLISASETWAIEHGLTAVYINCGNRSEREKAHQFYKNNGYIVKSSGYFKPLPKP